MLTNIRRDVSDDLDPTEAGGVWRGAGEQIDVLPWQPRRLPRSLRSTVPFCLALISYHMVNNEKQPKQRSRVDKVKNTVGVQENAVLVVTSLRGELQSLRRMCWSWLRLRCAGDTQWVA
ncbi:unnamed protein product [Chrysodeixis includens]|uniref:Uncharacterized protein n=1 Tax=Chrysodeixis includens TaxID=689277 RepID=A0A9N8KU85_CHRIL|nr:unnamed protein product [Chrysodeixis includens]